jgi:hypothetical protein
MSLFERIWHTATSVVLSAFSWRFHRTVASRYRSQAHVTAAWVVREVRRAMNGHVDTELAWQLDQFQLFLAHFIQRELFRNSGYYPISNSPLLSPTALFFEAIQAARIHPPEPVVRALPHVRIRIVPGWVKVYGIGLHEAAPTVLYPNEFARP